MSEISKLNINGVAYDIKDAQARIDAAEARKDHEKMVNMETETAQSVNSTFKFNKGILLENGASVSDDGTTVTFK